MHSHDVRKSPIAAKDALALARKATDIYSTTGKKVLHHSVKRDGAPTPDIVDALMLGRSGTMRAPVVVAGKRIIVGFDPDLYTKCLT